MILIIITIALLLTTLFGGIFIVSEIEYRNLLKELTNDKE